MERSEAQEQISPAQAPESTRVPEDAASSGRVLLVDDEPAILRAYSRMLSFTGHVITCAENGEEALKILDRESFDVVLSDISMPGMSGTQLLRAVRARDLDVPVVLVTGSPTTETAMQAVEHGALRYLVKPVSLEDLKKVVKEAVWLHRIALLKRDALTHLGLSDKKLGDRASLEVGFERAMKQLWMAFQPIVHTGRNEVYAYEALVRSRDPAMPHPGALFGAAERLGRVEELGHAIRDRIAECMPSAPQGAVIFANLHTLDLTDESLYAATSPLARYADRIVLEITERAPLESVKDVPSRVAKLRAMGFRIAVDDLGAGYAGLTSFAQLVPEVAKLDMSIIRGIDRDPVKQKIVGALALVCRQLNVLTVAEGVETKAERDALVELGCDFLQGYLFAKPAEGFPSVVWPGG